MILANMIKKITIMLAEGLLYTQFHICKQYICLHGQQLNKKKLLCQIIGFHFLYPFELFHPIFAIIGFDSTIYLPVMHSIEEDVGTKYKGNKSELG